MNGQSILISHAILVGLSIFLVYAVSTTFISLKNDYQDFIGDNEVEQLCFVIKGAIDKIYIPPDYAITSDVMLGSVIVNMPEKIADMKYRAVFANQSVVVSGPVFNYTCPLGYSAIYNGTSSGSSTRFYYTRLANGTDLIGMERA